MRIGNFVRGFRHTLMWGFPTIRGTILGVPLIRARVFGGIYWGPLILGNYHVSLSSFPGLARVSYSLNFLRGVIQGIILGNNPQALPNIHTSSEEAPPSESDATASSMIDDVRALVRESLLIV